MKKIFIMTLACVMLLSTQALAFSFEQISPEELFSPEVIQQEDISDWAKKEIVLSWQAGLITEHTCTYMTKDMTRFQFAELIVNLAEKVTQKEMAPADANTFTDCSDPVILKAYAAGIVSGVGNSRFDPNANTNREQIASMIARAIDYITQETGINVAPAAAQIDAFSDKDQVSSWAVDGVGRLAANNIMSGTSATTLSPKNSCTVEQGILFCYRVYDRFQTMSGK